jgi:deoxyribodipyrimidine photolyase-related protein
LPRFADEQDAMLCDDPILSHALLSPYMNLGLLSPQEVCTAVEAAYRAGKVLINIAEGYMCQVIARREYMRGIYHRQGPDYATSNGLGHHAPLPPVYWSAPSKMACMRAAVDQTKRYS